MRFAAEGATIDAVSDRQPVDGRRRAWRAVADTRAVGGFGFAHLVGIRGGVPAPGRAVLTLEPVAPSTMALATLADVALGTALRSRLSPGRLLPTSDLTLDLVRPARGRVAAQARVLHLDDTGGTAACELSDDSGLVGFASGTFAAPPAGPGPGLPVTPWEVGLGQRPDDGTEPVAMTPAEQDFVQAVLAAQVRAGPDGPFGDALLDLTAPIREGPGGEGPGGEGPGGEGRSGEGRSGEGLSEATARVTPALVNRSGSVHGGALLALAAAVAVRLLPCAGWTLRSITYHFLRPVTGPDVRATATLRRQGRGAAVLGVDVSSQGADVGLAIVRFGPPAMGSGRSDG